MTPCPSAPSQLVECGPRCQHHTHRFQQRLLKVLGTMELLHCAVLLAVLVNAHAEVPVNVGEASVEVRGGEVAKLSCSTPSDIVFCTFVDPSGESFNMLGGLNYEDGRISYLGEDAKKDCGIVIKNVQEKDNGEWTCAITAITESGSAKKGTNKAIVTVVTPPSSVSIEGVESSLVLTYPEDGQRQVRCLAEGGRPAPSFSWFLDTEVYSGAVEDQEGAQVLTYTAEPEHNGKTLACVVNHKGYTEEQVGAKVNRAELALDIKFKPVAATKDSAFYGMKLGETFDILINFKSHPAPTELHWEMHDKTVVAQASENGRFTAAMMQDGPHTGMYTAKLTINKVAVEDQESENKLIVQNELGQTEYRFSLGLGEKPAVAGSNLDAGVPSIDEAGSGPVIAIVIVALIIVIIIVVAVVARAQGILCFADPPKEDDQEKAVEKEEGSDTESAEAADGAAKEGKDAEAAAVNTEIGRASCRERV